GHDAGNFFGWGTSPRDRAAGIRQGGEILGKNFGRGEGAGGPLDPFLKRKNRPQTGGWVPSSVCLTETRADVLAADVDIVIEVVGGLKPAYDWVRGALLAGKSVVTANKQLIAHHGTELIDLARSRGLEVRFEASVAGGIPVLRALQEGLAGDRLGEGGGILNGNCA